MSLVGDLNLEKLASFIYHKTGIKLKGRDLTKLSSKVENRMKELEMRTFRDYFFKLRFSDRDGAEFEQLVNLMTVNETYFFREDYQFDVLVKHLLPILKDRKSSNAPIRILNAPCSTGDEPFSIVIKLLEDNRIINDIDIEIIGIDIDSTIIEKAQKGVYSSRALHKLSATIKAKYFTYDKKKDQYTFDPELSGAVTFKRVNVFDKMQLRALGKFDVIFSRNMLIYFDDASRKEVVMNFYDMVNRGGYVMLGHAEFMNRIVSVFQAERYDDVLVYKK
jgi:chemotaxis protein methyltransferase CheR